MANISAAGPGDNTADREPNVIEAETAARAIDQLQVVLALTAEGALKCSQKTRRPSSATVQLLAQSLPGGDFYADDAIASFAWPLLIQSGGLAVGVGTRLQLTAKGRAAQKKDPAEVIRALWRQWIRRGAIDEFSRVDAIKGQRSASALSAATRRRAEVAEGLALCPAGEWIGVDELFTLMQDEGIDPAVHRTEQGLWRLYLDHPEYGSFGYAGMHAWELLQGRYVLAVLFEYAGTLGLVDLRYTDPEGARDDFRDHYGAEDLQYLSRYDGLQAVRLNSLGECCLVP